MSAPQELLWALIGLLLTIAGTFLEAHIPNFPWNWSQQGIHTQSLGVTYQIGAVLLVGCMGGKNAAALSQIAYLVLGLTPWFPIFSQGGGLQYLQEPTFGYLLAFIPGAWVCGWLAFKTPPRLESLAFSCICGLFAIHFVGLVYLALTHSLLLANGNAIAFWQAAGKYSFTPFPKQLIIGCAIAVISFFMRKLMFY
jgi:biotin transport system substrate-specific component